jgi:hypothetical protein
MSKRKPAHGRGPTTAAKAQRAAQAIVRSPKDSRSARAGTTASPRRRPEEPQQESLLVDNPVTALEPVAALQDDCKQTMMHNVSKKGIDFSSAGANVWAYQAKLLEMAQANMQFAFEFAQRLSTIRSPVEFPSVIAEFTSKRIAMFRKHSTEMGKLGTER